MTQTKYEPVGEENEVQEDVARKPRSNRNTIHWVVHFVQLAILIAVLGVFYSNPWTLREQTSKDESDGVRMDISVTFTDDVYHGNSSSPYVGLPSDEQDKRWEQLYHQHVTINDKQTQLSVYHQMWCLDFLRKMCTPYFYFPEAGIEELGRLGKQRQHCIDQLRQYVMCNADITEMPMEEVDGIKIGSSRVEHKKCADYSALLEKY
ncbi:hypothetical protein B0I72DRAFT_135997 [Yarrowia lipolytica]|uniref:YALI0B05434p n=2 Tax=Yarrowia lipolytica TaxID=4952 RepID=Q6CFN3_YARLI|nr:YALI0B05434p [Yarrowia lipolytica CLIB122]AOW01270.1 hypothetical protein YALI1_B07413g [Yarrowia lipolytica]KAB8285355.1 hypothetical protein BKA91DRAFT_133653 [Yarrowia lipolytica]KAE8174979.1 hypothetical protein BKA90DRAFT_133246 [Yarrowia lipolytica]KAJ8052131.1 hypothetical protein LXG23DRAFT_50210 [Yarrowia lipolytica]QNP96573.1 Hypothetical protein YALI2_C00226g [Yarrowia lipolytica]|eukprot:XP_500529.1 YALI0B05434p [Yarrowia lipolytica CLIB122]